MKIVFSNLLFTFVVFLNSIVLSSQVNHIGGQEGDNPRSLEVTIRTKTIQYPQPGERFLLPNGNVYVSNGSRPILMFFNIRAKVVTIEQPPGTPGMILGEGPYTPAPYNNWPGTFSYRV